MDPKYQDDDTFARTDERIERLRGTYHDEDWREWRRTILESVKAGRQLEEQVEEVQRQIPLLSKASAVAALVRRLDVLEVKEKQRNDLTAKVWGALAKVGLVVLGWALTKLHR